MYMEYVSRRRKVRRVNLNLQPTFGHLSIQLWGLGLYIRLY